MGMNGSAITGDGEGIRVDQSSLYRRKDSNSKKEFLEPCFEIERDIFTVHKALFNFFSDGGGRFGSFLSFSFWLLRFFSVPRSREQLITFIQTGIRGSPEAVHKIKVGAKWRKGITGTTDEGGKDTVVSEA